MMMLSFVWHKGTEIYALPTEIKLFLNDRFSRSLFILGDTTTILCKWTVLLTAYQGNDVVGVGAIFNAFLRPLVMLVADESSVSRSILDEICHNVSSPFLIVLNSKEPIALDFSGEIEDDDIWMRRSTSTICDSIQTVKITDAKELIALYKACGLSYWNSDMLLFGHCFGVRRDGRLVSATGVNFILSDHSYAQIGNVATLNQWRGFGFASACIRSMITSLHSQGILTCGLLAPRQSQKLTGLYRRLGFQETGGFLFCRDFSSG